MVDGEEERDPAHEVRCDDVEQRPPLGVGLAHELDVAEPEVAQTAVDQLRRGTRGGAAEVAPIDESDPEPCPGRLVRDPCPDDAAADDEQVVRCARELASHHVTAAAWTRAQGH